MPILHSYIWIRRDSLLFWTEVLIILILKITESSTKRKISIYSIIFNHMSRFVNSLFLKLIVWFVIFT